MTAAHTPGPWQIKTRPFAFDCDAKGWPIHSANGYGIGRVWDENGKPQNEANARLIVAAPELLEALQLARDLFVNEGSACAEICDAAIAKATGAA